MGVGLATSEPAGQSYEQRDPDVRLMLDVRADNAAAFEELVLRYQNRLVTVLEHLVGRRETAEDLAQETFLRVYRARKSYVPGSKFATWLFTIANNVASNSRRSQRRRREVHWEGKAGGESQPAMTLDQLAQAASGQMPTRLIDKAEMRDVVRLAVETLGERQRMAVLLNKFEGMSYEEISQTMRMSTKAVKSLLTRARVNLRVVLEPYLERGQHPEQS